MENYALIITILFIMLAWHCKKEIEKLQNEIKQLEADQTNLKRIAKYTLKPQNFELANQNIVGYVVKDENAKTILYLLNNENVDTNNIEIQKADTSKYTKTLYDMGVMKYIK